MKRKVQWCYVGNSRRDLARNSERKQYKRIFIADVGGDYPILAVDGNCERKYIDGEQFDGTTWKYCEMIEEPEYVPFDATNIEDVKQLVGKVLVGKYTNTFLIQSGNITQSKLNLLFDSYTFEDGSPVGKLKQ